MNLQGTGDGNTPLDPDECRGLKHPHVTTRGQLDHLEQANMQEGLRWLDGKKQADLLREEFVRELHRRLFGEVWSWAGQFRTTEKNIGIDPRQIAVELRKLLDDMRHWAEHDTYPPLETAMRFHHRLVAIHPFPNGNGRHARILTDALLARLYGSKPINWTGDGSAVTPARRKEYLDALRAADAGNYEPLLAFAGAGTEEKGDGEANV